MSTYTSDHSDDEPTREDRRDLYEKLLRIVEYNTGDGAPATMAREQVLVTATHAGIDDPKRVRSVLNAAVDNGDLLRVRGRVARTDVDSLHDVYLEEGGRDNANSELVGWCYRQLNEAGVV